MIKLTCLTLQIGGANDGKVSENGTVTIGLNAPKGQLSLMPIKYYKEVNIIDLLLFFASKITMGYSLYGLLKECLLQRYFSKVL